MTPLNATTCISSDTAIATPVLLVDDDELMRMHLAAILQYEGYHVQTAGSAITALEILARTPGCVLLADWEMPEMDGLDLCRTIRALERDSYVYVLLLTIRGAEGDVLAGFDAGADDYVIKGAPTEELIARLECGRRILAHLETVRGKQRTHARLATVPALPSSDDLANRLALDYDRCSRHNAPLSVLAFDVDYLECVADRFGAGVSTDVLASIRAEVRKLLLESDWTASLDGETFLVVMPHATLDAARLVARKVRALIAAGTRFCTTGIPLTASVGIVTLEHPGEFRLCAPKSLVERVVECLQQSVLQGGDCVTTAHLMHPIP